VILCYDNATGYDVQLLRSAPTTSGAHFNLVVKELWSKSKRGSPLHEFAFAKDEPFPAILLGGYRCSIGDLLLLNGLIRCVTWNKPIHVARSTHSQASIYCAECDHNISSHGSLSTIVNSRHFRFKKPRPLDGNTEYLSKHTRHHLHQMYGWLQYLVYDSKKQNLCHQLTR